MRLLALYVKSNILASPSAPESGDNNNETK